MKKIKTIAKNLFGAKRMKTLALMLLCGTIATYAQNAAGDYTAGTDALATVTEEIAKYVPFVVKLCYAIAGVVAVVGAISVYIAMNNEEQDVKKKIMMVVGACIFLVAAAQALPLFFGLEPVNHKQTDGWKKQSRTAATQITHCSRACNAPLNLWVFKV